MKTRASKKKPSATDYLASPINSPESPSHSPIESPPIKFDFNLGGLAETTSSSKKKKSSAKSKTTSCSVPIQAFVSPSPMKEKLSSIGDLKELASSRLESVKRQMDRSNSEIVKEVETFGSRLHKRFKIQTQASQQVIDEAEKEYKKMSERISESQEAMKASYMDFVAEAQASAARVCRTSIPELAQSLEKSIDVLRSRYASTSG